MSLEPPFRLRTAEEVARFAGRSAGVEKRRMVDFARAHDLVLPPLLAELPESIPLVVYDVKTVLRAIIQDLDLSAGVDEAADLLGGLRASLLAAVEKAPEDKFALEDDLWRKGKRIEQRLARRAAGPAEEDPPPAGPLVSEKLERKADLFDLLGRLLRQYLNTRNPSVRRYLTEALLALAACDPATHELDGPLVTRVRAAPAGVASGALLQDLHQLVCVRLPRIRRMLYSHYLLRFTDATKKRVWDTPIRPNLKKNLTLILDQARSEESTAGARAKLARITAGFAPLTAPEEMRRVGEIVGSYLEKVDEFVRFFDRGFSARRVEGLVRLYGPAPVRHELREEQIATGVTLTLYPTKDYHDLMKGHYSDDCTAGFDLASRHLLHPRFFNLRIFHEKRWVGNVYALDYSDRGAVILDRIQISGLSRLMPLEFFPRFLATLTQALKARSDLRVLAPPVISNFEPVQKSYARYRADRPREKFVFAEADRAFEASRAKRLAVLT